MLPAEILCVGTSGVGSEVGYLELVDDDLHAGAGAARVRGGQNADQAGVVVQAGEGGTVGHPVVLVQHAAVQARVHALACKTMQPFPMCFANISYTDGRP